jgi:hypothetical protein
LLALLESKYEEINELGCFMAVEVARKSEIPKMFSEGIVTLLKRFATNETTTTTKTLSMLTLMLLEIDITEIVAPARSTPTIPMPNSDLDEWLSFFGPDLAALADLLKKNSITVSNIVYLTETDMEQLQIPLGPRRKLQNAIKSLKHYLSGNSLPIQCLNQENDQETIGPCLVCAESPKQVCCVPCGHVVLCETCAEIIRARKDRCIICRKPVKQFVRMFIL